MDHSEKPVTVVITRAVRSGSEQEFEEAVKAWIPKALDFPGYLGVHMLRPPPGSREYGAVVKFRTQKEWDAFRNAPQYVHFLAQIRPYLEDEPRVETECGLESWFTPLGSQVLRVPPRWKMAIVTWLGVCLMVYPVSSLVSPLTTDWPWFLRYSLINAGVVAGLTWAVMPVLSGLFQFWLHPAATNK
jgi:hypothetical protein